MSSGVLVAGIGNIFLSDDGFGVEVANRLAAEPCRPGSGWPTSASAASTWLTSCSRGTTAWSWSTPCPWARSPGPWP